MSEFTPIENSDNKPNGNAISNGTFNDVAAIFDYEKGGDTIEKELSEFEAMSNSQKEEVNEVIEEKGGFSLDDLKSDETSAFESVPEEEAVEEEAESIEEYFTSAEFVIFILELVIVWGTNMYLKNNDLDKIGIEEFKKTAREQRELVKVWAEMLQKYNMKIGVEMRMIFAMGTTYAFKVKAIVKNQEEKKLNEKRKTTKKLKVKKSVEPKIENTDVKDLKVVGSEIKKEVKRGNKKTKITKDNFRLDKSKEIETI